MQGAFFNCKKLKSLNLSNFKTSNVIYVNSTFARCFSLTSIDLSNFDTARVQYMDSMFESCYSLYLLNLSNFYTQSIIYMNLVFYECTSLEYIDFRLYDESENLKGIISSLDKVPENIVLCIDINNTIDELMKEINKKLCPTIYCGNDWKAHQKIIIDNNTCLDSNSIKLETTIISSPTSYQSITESINYINNTILNTYSFPDIETTNNFILHIESTNKIIFSSINNLDNIKTTILDKANAQTMSVYNNTEFSDYIKNTDYQIIESYNTTQKLHILTTYYKNDELNEINYSTVVSLYNNATISLIKTEYIEASNLTAEEMNKKIYEEIINKILGDFTGLNGEEIITEGKDNYYYHLTTLENELNQRRKNK